MRSGISSYKTVFCKTVARFWPIWASWLLVWLLMMPLSVLMDQRYGTALIRADFLDTLETYTTMDVMVIGYAVISAMAVLSPLYKTRSANFMGSLPVRREGLFCTYYLAGFCFGALPAVAVSLIMLIIGAAIGISTLAPVGLWLLVCVGKYLFFYSFAVFCGMFAGHILALPAYYGIFNVLVYALYMLLDDIFRTFYYGYSNMGDAVQNAVELLTPIQVLYNVRLRIGYTVVDHMPREIEPVLNGGFALLLYSIAAVVLTVAALLLFRKRRLESAEDVVAVNPMKPVFRYSVAICAGLFFGYVTNMILDGDTVSWMVCTILWGVFGSFVAQMILDKSFKVLRKWKGAAAVAGVFVLLYLVIAFDLTGFETRIPDASEVESITLPVFYSYPADLHIYHELTVTDPDRIQDFITLHETAVEQRDRPLEDERDRPSNTGMKIQYKLKNGSTFERRYSFYVDPAGKNQEGTGAYALQRMLSDKAFMWHFYELDELDQNTVRYIEYYNHYYAKYDYANVDDEVDSTAVQVESEYFNNHDSMIFEGEDAERIVQAIRDDFDSGRFYQQEVQEVEESESDPRPLQYGRELHVYFQYDKAAYEAEQNQNPNINHYGVGAVYDSSTDGMGDYEHSLYVRLPVSATATHAVLDELINEVLSDD